jgi:hypothetical protein
MYYTDSHSEWPSSKTSDARHQVKAVAHVTAMRAELSPQPAFLAVAATRDIQADGLFGTGLLVQPEDSG